MTPQEAITLIRIVRAACPAQKLDEYTIDVWADALRDTDYGQAHDAVRRLVLERPFIAVSDIIANITERQRNANRQLSDRAKMRELDASRQAHDRDASHAAYLDARAAFDAALADKKTRTEHTS